jgi:hypothetical protein
MQFKKFQDIPFKKAGTIIILYRYKPDEMMPYSRQIMFRRNSCSNIHFPVKLAGVGRNDFSIKVGCNFDRNIGFADTGGAEHNYQNIFH